MLVPEAIERYLENVRATKRPRTLESAAQILSRFARSFPDRILAEVQPADLVGYIGSLKLSNRSKANQHIRITALFRHHGILLKADRPRFTQSIPQVYGEKDLAQFFAACELRQLVYFKTLLMTGVRMSESKWLEWSDVTNGLLHVRAKPPNFLPKTHEERRIPIPQALQSLLNRLDRRPGTLIFPTASGRPDRHLLRHCKRIAQRAGLDESRWSLHGFRRTFCTACLRAGLDVRTVMLLMGHHDIESTLRDWRPLEMEQLRGRMSGIFQ